MVFIKGYNFILIASALFGLLNQASANHDIDSLFEAIPPPSNSFSKEQLKINPEHIVKFRSITPNVKPINNIPIQQCDLDKTIVYNSQSKIIISNKANAVNVENSVISTAYVSCLKATSGFFGPIEYLFDIQLYDVNLKSIDSKGKISSTKLDDRAFKYATRFSSNERGTINSIFVDKRETRDILRIKKSIIQSLQTQLYFNNGEAEVVQKDILSEHKLAYFAVNNKNTNRFHVESSYSRENVLQFAKDVKLGDESFDFKLATKSIFSDDKLQQQLSRTITSNDAVEIIASSDTTYAYSLDRIPSKDSDEVQSLFGLVVELLFHGTSSLNINLSLVDDKKNKRKFAVPRVKSNSDKASQINAASLESFMFENDLLYSPSSQNPHRYHKRSSEIEDLIIEVRDGNSDRALTTLSLAAKEDPLVSDIILSHLKSAYVSGKAESKRTHAASNADRFISALASALAGSTNDVGHRYLLELAKNGDDHARAALILNADNTSEQFVLDASRELNDDQDSLIIGSLVAEKSKKFAHKVMSSRLNLSENLSKTNKRIAYHSIKNMGNNADVFSKEVRDFSIDETLEMNHEDSSNHLERRGWFSKSDPNIIRPEFETTPENFNWTSLDEAHFLIASYTSRLRDTIEYPIHSSFVTSGEFGSNFAKLKLAGGAFAGLKSSKCVDNESKVFSRAVARIEAFNQKIQLADISVAAHTELEEYTANTVVKVMGKVIRSKEFTQECFAGAYPLGRIRTPLLSKRFFFPVYSTIVDIGIALQAGVNGYLRFETCNPRQAAIAIIPELAFSVAGSAGASIFQARIGLDIGGESSGTISPQTSLGTIKGTEALTRIPGENPIKDIHVNGTDTTPGDLEETPIEDDTDRRDPSQIFDPFSESLSTLSFEKNSKSKKRVISAKKALRRFGKSSNPFSDRYFKRDSVGGMPLVTFPAPPPSKPYINPEFKENEVCRACVSLNFAFDPSDFVVYGSLSIPGSPGYQHEIYRYAIKNRNWGPVKESIRCSN